MRTEPRSTRRFSLGWIVAAAVFGVAVPVGAWGSAGSNFNLSDRSGRTAGAEARITNNKLGVALCDTATTGVFNANCARVLGGALRVTDGAGPMTVNGRVAVTDGNGRLSVDDGGASLTVDGAVGVRPLAPMTPYSSGCEGQSIGEFATCRFATGGGGRITLETIGMDASVPLGQSIWEARVQVRVNGSNRDYPVLLTKIGTNKGRDHYQAAAPAMTLYADANSDIVVWIGRSATDTAHVGVRVSGHR